MNSILLNNFIKRSDTMQKNYIILSIILIICSTLFLVGCSSEKNQELSYEIISFENAPKELQERIMLYKDENRYSNEGYNFSGSYDLGKEKYHFLLTNEGRVPKFIGVEPDKALGSGVIVKYTGENKEDSKFPYTVSIIKFNEYYGKIRHVYVSHE